MPAPLPLTTDVRAGTEITINFSDGALRGSAGCNSYQAAYTRDASALTIGSTAATEMFCLSPEGVMEQEDHYLRALEDVVGFHIYGFQLWLETGDGRALVFSAPKR
jgi:heat shock protein HslJ